MKNNTITVRDKIKQLKEQIAHQDRLQWSQPSNNRALIIHDLEKELRDLLENSTSFAQRIKA